MISRPLLQVCSPAFTVLLVKRATLLLCGGINEFVGLSVWGLTTLVLICYSGFSVTCLHVGGGGRDIPEEGKEVKQIWDNVFINLRSPFPLCLPSDYYVEAQKDEETFVQCVLADVCPCVW